MCLFVQLYHFIFIFFCNIKFYKIKRKVKSFLSFHSVKKKKSTQIENTTTNLELPRFVLGHSNIPSSGRLPWPDANGSEHFFSSNQRSRPTIGIIRPPSEGHRQTPAIVQTFLPCAGSWLRWSKSLFSRHSNRHTHTHTPPLNRLTGRAPGHSMHLYIAHRAGIRVWQKDFVCSSKPLAPCRASCLGPFFLRLSALWSTKRFLRQPV